VLWYFTCLEFSCITEGYKVRVRFWVRDIYNVHYVANIVITHMAAVCLSVKNVCGRGSATDPAWEAQSRRSSRSHSRPGGHPSPISSPSTPSVPHFSEPSPNFFLCYAYCTGNHRIKHQPDERESEREREREREFASVRWLFVTRGRRRQWSSWRQNRESLWNPTSATPSDCCLLTAERYWDLTRLELLFCSHLHLHPESCSSTSPARGITLLSALFE